MLLQDDNKCRVLDGVPSLFLDSIRLFASLVVFIGHVGIYWYPNSIHMPSEPGDYTHASVIVFFVLSGFVISATTKKSNRGPVKYAIARLTRLCSVVWPALLITAIIEVVFLHWWPESPLILSRGFSGLRYLMTGLFASEIWFLSATPPINGPLWSLSYEFWYYAIFGLWFYRKSNSKIFYLLIIACVIAGPKILLMMPIWLFGYFSYSRDPPALPNTFKWVLVAVMLLIALGLILYLPPFPFFLGKPSLFYAGQFVTDWIIGFFVGLALWFLPSYSHSLSVAQTRCTKIFRKTADLTFPLYVLHFPMILLWGALVEFHLNDFSQFIGALVVILVVAFILGLLMEKLRPEFGRFFIWIFNVIFKLPVLNEPKTALSK